MRRFRFFVVCFAVAFAPILFAITDTEMDDFEDGTVENWEQPAVNGEPQNIATGGPEGVDDNYLQVISNGGGGPGSRMAVVNNTQWTGDYESIGGEFTISMKLANFGANPLSVRIGVEGPATRAPGEGGEGVAAGVGRWVSTNAFALPADGVWRTTSFTLSEAEMTSVGAMVDFDTLMSAVGQFRIISAATPDWIADAVAATMGVDDIQVESVPVELQSFSIE
ncbi:MAG: hypothetical protein AAGN46_09255 [Acidobacteriota bacterium]